MNDQQLKGLFDQYGQIIRHLQAKVDGLERFHALGIIPTLTCMKEATEKVVEAIRYNQEAQERFAQYAQNAGAVYSEQIPGKRTPFFLNTELTVPAGSESMVNKSMIVQGGGPFEIAQIMGICRSDVPVAVGEQGVITRQVRFRGINSAIMDPLASPDPAAVAQPSYTPNITYNGVFDFLWTYQAGKSSKFRSNNIPIPSAFLFSNDRPLYLACGDLLDSVDNVNWSITPLFPSFAWIGGIAPDAVADTAQPVIVTMTMHGVVYAQAPDQRT